ASTSYSIMVGEVYCSYNVHVCHRCNYHRLLHQNTMLSFPSVLYNLIPGRTNTMLGMIMNTPLLVSSILRHAANYHADREVVSQTVEGHMHRYTYTDLSKRSQQ